MSGQWHVTKLNSRSVVFDRMLDQNMMEAQMGEVDILDADPDTLKRMLEFIYTGQVEVASFWNAQNFSPWQVKDENYTAELLYAADKYGLDGLVNMFTFAAKFKPVKY